MSINKYMDKTKCPNCGSTYVTVSKETVKLPTDVKLRGKVKISKVVNKCRVCGYMGGNFYPPVQSKPSK